MLGMARRVVAVQRTARRRGRWSRAPRPPGCARPGVGVELAEQPVESRRRRPAGRCSSGGWGRPGDVRPVRAPRSRAAGNIVAMSPTPPAWSRWMWVTTTVARSPGPTPSAASASRTTGADGRRAGLHQARTVGEDQVSGGNLAVSSHPGVDLETSCPSGVTPASLFWRKSAWFMWVSCQRYLPFSPADAYRHLRQSHADSYIVSTICPQQAGAAESGCQDTAGARRLCPGEARKRQL